MAVFDPLRLQIEDAQAFIFHILMTASWPIQTRIPLFKGVILAKQNAYASWVL